MEVNMALGEPLPVSSVVGVAAKSFEGEDVGTVTDVVVDEGGRSRFALIELRRDSRLVAIPWEMISRSAGEQAIRLNVTAKKLNAAPALNRGDEGRVRTADWQRDVCTYYGSKPYWAEPWDESAVVSPVQRRHRGGLQLALAAILLVVVAGLGYLTFRQGWSTTAGQVSEMAAAVREKTAAFRHTSSDAATTAKVKAALALAKNVSALDINVDTQDGVTTLTGKVPSPENRELAGQIAAETSGVREVRNVLNVDPEIRPDQGRQYLANRMEELERQIAITEALQDIPEMEGAKVKVRASGDSILLEGTVISDAQKSRADQVSRSFAGVQNVENRLRIVAAY
jgi:osmotically-inducible protein OsmY